MKNRERLRELFAELKTRHAAVAGIRVHSFVQAEAAIEAAADMKAPVILMVSSARKNLGPFIRALQWLCSASTDAFVQLVGDDPVELARAAIEVEADAVYMGRIEFEAARALCEGLHGSSIATEIVLPWHQAESGGVPEGWLVDRKAARPVVALDGLDVAAVPVGGGPGPYKSWRIPLWSLDSFKDVTAMRTDVFYALPWASLLPKDLITRYNTYGGALPGVISLPHQQFRAFISSGAVKVNFRSDCALAFLAGLRESLFRRPEEIDITVHLLSAKDALVEFLHDRLADLKP
jgi:fructose/tagatose bisphosphate aldolase